MIPLSAVGASLGSLGGREEGLVLSTAVARLTRFKVGYPPTRAEGKAVERGREALELSV